MKTTVKGIKGQDFLFFSLTTTYTTMLQGQRIPTLKELVERLPLPRDIPSLTNDQARESLLKARKLLDATVVAVKQLQNWSLRLNFEAMAVAEQSRLKDDVHNKQINKLTEMLAKITDFNWEPFRAIFNRATNDFNAIEKIAWQINFTMRKMSEARKIAKLTTQVKNMLKKLDHQANKFNALSQHIFKTSQTYHSALQTLEAYGRPSPQWYVHGNQNNNPLIFSLIHKECWGWTQPEYLLWKLLRPCCRFFQCNSHRWWSILMMMMTMELWTINELCQSRALSSGLFYSHCCSINSFNFTLFALGLRGP